MDWVAMFEHSDEGDTPAPGGPAFRSTRERHDRDINDATLETAAQAWGRGGDPGSRGVRSKGSGGAQNEDGSGDDAPFHGESDVEAGEFEGPGMVYPPSSGRKKGNAQEAFTTQSIVREHLLRTANGEKSEGGDSGSDEVSEDSVAQDTVPLYRKYATSVQRGYRARPYESISTDESEDADAEGNGGAGDETSSETPKRIRNEKKTRRKKPNATLHREECFLCSWGDRFHDGISAEAVNRLNKILELNYGQIENASIAQMLHIYYKKKIYDPSRGMRMLTQEVALEHIEQLHSLDPRIMLGEMIRRYHRLILVLENEIFYSNGAFGRFQFAALNQAARMLLSLYKSDPVKMNFYDAKREINTKTMGALMNLRAEFTERKADAKRHRQQQQAVMKNMVHDAAPKRPRPVSSPGDSDEIEALFGGAPPRSPKRARTEEAPATSLTSRPLDPPSLDF